MRAKEVMEVLRISRTTLYRYVKQGLVKIVLMASMIQQEVLNDILMV